MIVLNSNNHKPITIESSDGLPTLSYKNPGIQSNQPFLFVDPGKIPSELLCLTEAVYFEGRGENNKKAIIDVIMNRTNSKYFPNDICAVINQPYQFSYTLDKNREVNNEKIWELIRKVVVDTYFDKDYSDSTRGALYYYNPQKVKTTPSWVASRYFLFKSGGHAFYSWHETKKRTTHG